MMVDAACALCRILNDIFRQLRVSHGDRFVRSKPGGHRENVLFSKDGETHEFGAGYERRRVERGSARPHSNARKCSLASEITLSFLGMEHTYPSAVSLPCSIDMAWNRSTARNKRIEVS